MRKLLSLVLPALFFLWVGQGRGYKERGSFKCPVCPSWVQVNLTRKMRVTGVVTQGASRAGSAEYVKTFKVAYSLDGRKFQFIEADEGFGDKVRPYGP